MRYSKKVDKHGETESVQVYKTAAARDIACEAFGFVAIGAAEARPYIARDETAERNHIPYADRDTNVMDMHSIMEYWEDEDAWLAAKESGEFD